MDMPISEIQVIRDPLKAAVDIKTLRFRSSEKPRSFPEPSTATRIEHKARYDRLAAAEDADIFLFRSTQQYLKRPGNPNLADRLVSALGVWAITRSSLGLSMDALISMTHALRWVEDCPGTSSSAFAHQRSARLVASEIQGFPGATEKLGLMIDQEIHTALHHHLLTEAGDEAAGSTLLDIARIHFSAERYSMARVALRAALSRFSPKSPLRFEVYRLSVLSRLKEGTKEGTQEISVAAEALKAAQQVEFAEDALSKGQQLDALDLQAQLRQAEGKISEVVTLRLQALELATAFAGAERRLDELVALSTALESASGPLDDAGRQLVDEATGKLLWEIDQPLWCGALGDLHQYLISGPPFIPPSDKIASLREQLIVHHQRMAGGDSVDLTGGPLSAFVPSASTDDDTTVCDDEDWN